MNLPFSKKICLRFITWAWNISMSNSWYTSRRFQVMYWSWSSISWQYCDNKETYDVEYNPVQYDWTKHDEVDRFFIKEKLDRQIVSLPKIKLEAQLVDILTKTISKQVSSKFLSKLGIWDIYASTWGGAMRLSQRFLVIIIPLLELASMYKCLVIFSNCRRLCSQIKGN